MQDLLLAQKRDRPAYCFQHLDLELRSHDDGGRANLAGASVTLAPCHDVVACFEPEWNSLGVNKTRSVNILGGIHHTGMHSFAAFAPAEQTPPAATPPRSGEVFVISGGRLCRRGARERPVAQPRPHRATEEIQCKHDEAKLEPIAGAAGD